MSITGKSAKRSSVNWLTPFKVVSNTFGHRWGGITETVTHPEKEPELPYEEMVNKI